MWKWAANQVPIKQPSMDYCSAWMLVSFCIIAPGQAVSFLISILVVTSLDLGAFSISFLHLLGPWTCWGIYVYATILISNLLQQMLFRLVPRKGHAHMASLPTYCSNCICMPVKTKMLNVKIVLLMSSVYYSLIFQP